MLKVHLCSPNSRAGARGIGEAVYIHGGRRSVGAEQQSVNCDRTTANFSLLQSAPCPQPFKPKKGRGKRATQVLNSGSPDRDLVSLRQSPCMCVCAYRCRYAEDMSPALYQTGSDRGGCNRGSSSSSCAVFILLLGNVLSCSDLRGKSQNEMQTNVRPLMKSFEWCTALPVLHGVQPYTDCSTISAFFFIEIKSI